MKTLKELKEEDSDMWAEIQSLGGDRWNPNNPNIKRITELRNKSKENYAEQSRIVMTTDYFGNPLVRNRLYVFATKCSGGPNLQFGYYLGNFGESNQPRFSSLSGRNTSLQVAKAWPVDANLWDAGTQNKLTNLEQ